MEGGGGRSTFFCSGPLPRARPLPRPWPRVPLDILEDNRKGFSDRIQRKHRRWYNVRQNETGDIKTSHHIEHCSKSIHRCIYQLVELQPIHSGCQFHKLNINNTEKVEMIQHHRSQVPIHYLSTLRFLSTHWYNTYQTCVTTTPCNVPGLETIEG
jgi:hypothetical protein